MAQTTAVVPTGPIQDASKPHPHTSNKLEDQAALAALYVTKYDSSSDGQRFLDSDHKLSSAGKFNSSECFEFQKQSFVDVSRQALQHPSNTPIPKTSPATPPTD